MSIRLRDNFLLKCFGKTSHCQFILKPMSEITILRIKFSEFYITIMCTDILLKETILRILHHLLAVFNIFYFILD